jgi:hypothetical protein
LTFWCLKLLGKYILMLCYLKPDTSSVFCETGCLRMVNDNYGAIKLEQIVAFTK